MFYLMRLGAFTVCFAILRHDVSFATAVRVGTLLLLSPGLTWRVCRADRHMWAQNIPKSSTDDR